MSLHKMPLTGEGIDQLVVITTFGVHIIQLDMEQARKKILNSVKIMDEIADLESKIQAMQQKNSELKREPKEPSAWTN